MGMVRKLLACILALCVVMEAIIVPEGRQEVQAAEIKGFQYEELGETIRITKYKGTETDVIIPILINDKSVVEIGDHAFENCTNLRSVYISRSVTSIGTYAFSGCESLKKIEIPDNNVIHIGDYAFENCAGLKEITVLSNVKTIGSHTFSGCEGIEQIVIPRGVTSIGDYAFWRCRGLKEISIPSSVTSIGFSAFEECGALDKIYYGGTQNQWNKLILETGNSISLRDATKVYEYMSAEDAEKYFDYIVEYDSETPEDQKVTIVKYIGTEKTVNIPGNIDGKSVTKIGNRAFKDCTGLTEVYIPESVTDIGVAAFQNTGLTQIDLSREDGVNRIAEGVFEGCKSLTEITLPDSVESIGRGAFSGCTSLTEISFGERIENIDAQAFLGCTGLKETGIPENVTCINESVFEGCTGLKKIEIPYGVLTIKKNAFKNCIGLSDIYYGAEKEYWVQILASPETDLTGNEQLSKAAVHYDDFSEYSSGDYKYKYLDGETTIEITEYIGPDSNIVVEIPEKINGKDVTSIGESSFKACSNIEQIKMPDGIVRIGDDAFRECKKLKTIHLSSGLTSMGKGVFYGCVNLTGISLPAGLTDIGTYTFQNCKSITEINIPSGVTSIGDGVFYWCENLKKASLPSGVTNIGGFAFSNCGNLTEINIPSSVVSIGDDAFQCCMGLTLFNIPNGVTNIEHATFSGCKNLLEIGIPQSVTNIGAQAFRDCEKLKAVYYSGTDEQWDKVTIDPDYNEWILHAKVHLNDNLEDSYLDPSKKFRYKILDDGSLEIIEYIGSDTVVEIPEQIDGKRVVSIHGVVFYVCKEIKEIKIADSVTKIGEAAFEGCTGLEKINIPNGVKDIGPKTFYSCIAFQDVYYAGTKEQWEKIKIDATGNEPLQNATIHYNYGTKPVIPDEPQIEDVASAKQVLENLTAGDALSLEPAFQPYLSQPQIDIMESYLYIWLAEVNYAYKYSGSSGVKDYIRKKAGIDPQGDFTFGNEQAITHISVDTKYGKKTFEITLDLGKPDSSGNLYPAYGTMHYELLQKRDIPSDVPKAGQIGKTDYTDMGAFVQSVSKAAEDSFHGTYQWQSLNDEMVAGVLVDKTVAEIIGNKNGSFSDGTFVIYEKPLFAYSKKVIIACPVDVRIFTMDGQEAGSIVNNKIDEKDENVDLDVKGDTKMVYLRGNDYYLDLRGTDTGKMNYTVEEIANDDVCRDVQFLELQLKKDLQYEGYVFRPLNIDSDLYALRKVDGSGKETILSNKDTYESVFKKVQGLSLSHGEATLDKNRSVQLNASLYPLDASNQDLQWTTDNQSVLSVDGNGLVTAVGAGSATVTVSTKDGSFLKQYCVINVKGGSGNSGGTGGTGNSGSTGGSGNSGGSGSSGGTGGSGSSGNTGSSGNGANGSGSSGNNSDNSGNNADDTKPSLEPETPPVVVALHYVLQFQTNGGINLSRKTMTLLADDNPGIMPKIQRKGYVFDGWYTQQNGGEQVTGDQPLKAAATLYAHWTKAKAPKKVSAPTLKSKKKGQMKVAFKKVKGAAGYQLQYSTKKGFASKKTKQLGASAKAKTISGLKAGKKYYARVRAYSTDSMGNMLYGKYSKVKGVKIHP